MQPCFIAARAHRAGCRSRSRKSTPSFSACPSSPTDGFDIASSPTRSNASSPKTSCPIVSKSSRSALLSRFEHSHQDANVSPLQGLVMLNDRENILSALREKALKVRELMRRANIPNEEICQSLLLKMRAEGV